MSNQQIRFNAGGGTRLNAGGGQPARKKTQPAKKEQGKGGQGGGGQPPRQPIEPIVGIVRGVISGDTVSILEIEDKEGQRQPKEILITLLGLKAPQLGRRAPDGVITKDENFAWQSREYLRKLVIGKPVVYRREHEAGGGRWYGELWDSNETDLRVSIVEAGWADVISRTRKDKNGKDLEPSSSQLHLESLRDKAKSKKKGIWSPNTKDAVRKVKYHEVYRDQKDTLQTDELYEFYMRIKDKGPLSGIVETVKTGTSLNILIPDTMDHFSLLLSGVRQNKATEAEQYAKESKFYTEYHLLHRDVKVVVDSIGKTSLYGTVTCGDFNISVGLLKMGFASFVEWNVPKDIATTIDQYKEAELHAQKERLRIWHSYNPPQQTKRKSEKDTGKGNKETSIPSGKVIEIVNASTITVRYTKSEANKASKSVDRIITLSSIRSPRAGTVRPPDEEDKSLTEEQLEQADKKKKEDEQVLKREAVYAQEAKEFLRNALIGQKVRCVLDYTRSVRQSPNETTPQVKIYWSVFYTESNNIEKNIAVELVKQGLARVVPHSEDEPRSNNYRDLVFAEKEAETANKGLHSPVYRKPSHLMNDLTPPPQSREGDDENENKSKRKAIVAKCRQFLSFFKRQSKTEAIVDYVFAAGRYKLRVPSNSCIIMFTLQCCIVERPEKNTKLIAVKPDISIFDKQFPPTTPGNLALHFARDQIFQRKVQISIEKVDPFGNFAGNLYINNKDFSLALLEQGHARLHVRSARDSSNFDAYKKAEDAAKKELKGLWATYDFEAENERRNKDLDQVQSERETFPIQVTDVRSSSHFSYQVLNSETSSLEELSASLQGEMKHSSKQPPYIPFDRNEIVAARFTTDDQWYRAQIINDNRTKGSDEEPTQYEVRYIDYGNREYIEKERIRQLPQLYHNLMKPQAFDAHLLWVKSPSTTSEYGRDALEGFRELVSGRTIYAQEAYKEKMPSKDKKEPQFLYHLILTNEEKNNVNKDLIAQGYARVEKFKRGADKRYDDEGLYSSFVEAEEYARTERLNIWQYGDYPDSDEDREVERSLMR